MSGHATGEAGRGAWGIFPVPEKLSGWGGLQEEWAAVCLRLLSLGVPGSYLARPWGAIHPSNVILTLSFDLSLIHLCADCHWAYVLGVC